MRRRRLATLVASAALLIGGTGLGTGSPAAAHAGGGTTHHSFVTRDGSTLKLDGKPFRFAGSNNYYLMYDSPLMVDDVFDRASAAGFPVLRTWGWLDIGNADGSNSVGSGKANGVYFQYWDGTKPAYNDGADGLSKLDYVIWKAGQDNIKLVIPFTNNWSDFGGMDQYVRWAGLTHHDDFYTNATIRGWYQAWISHLLNHVNPLTGLAYKNDPTIMTWELGNEPRCKGSGIYPPSSTCTTSTLTGWADVMSRYVKSIDHHHLTSVGDEGFLCTDPTSTDWTINCGEGVDSVALAKLPAIDVMSMHLYPDGWGQTADWGTTWITQHAADAKRLHKAVMLGEFGISSKSTRNVTYQKWTDAAAKSGVNGLLYWLLAGVQDDGTLYPDYDGFTVYCPTPVCQAISNVETTLRTGRRAFAPVADNDTAVTAFNTPVTAPATANDIAYLASVKPATLDLDPVTAGRQSTLTVASGQFTAAATGVVTFTPTDGFHGTATASYTVRDSANRLSNAATITVVVKPDPTAAISIASFEDGVGGWAPGNWQANAGTLSQTSAFHTDGALGLHVAAADGGWFGVSFNTPLDLSGKSDLKFDISTGPDTGTSTDIAVQVGPSYTWCQGNFTWVPQGTSTTFDLNLNTSFSCDIATMNDVRGLLIFIGPGPFDLDNVRAE